jgi:hypothetical protein
VTGATGRPRAGAAVLDERRTELAKSSLKARELPGLVPIINESLAAYDSALGVWTAEKNQGMHQQLTFYRAKMLVHLACIVPAAESEVHYEKALTQLRGIEQQCLKEQNQQGALLVGAQILHAETGLRSVRDDLIHAQGRDP